MKRILSFCSFLLIILITGQVNAQNLSCTQVLRSARATFDQGRLHELPTLLSGCLNTPEHKGGFTKSEKIEAYKILTLTYIYLQEPEKADMAMISLLQTDHFFEINEAVDPMEFKSLYKKFRTKPLLSFGAKIGFNVSHIDVQQNHYIWAASRGKGEYTSNIGLSGILFIEKDITDWFFDRDIQNKVVFNPEIQFNSSSFNYLNSQPSSLDNSEAPGAGLQTDRAEHRIDQTRLQTNLLLQYKIKNNNASPFVAIGPSLSYLMASNFTGAITVKSELTGPSINTLENYRKIGFAVVAAAGMKFKIGGLYLTFDVRHQRGLNNVVNKKNRYALTETNKQLWSPYGYVDNDFVLNQSMFNIGIIYPYFNPKKLIK